MCYRVADSNQIKRMHDRYNMLPEEVQIYLTVHDYQKWLYNKKVKDGEDVNNFFEEFTKMVRQVGGWKKFKAMNLKVDKLDIFRVVSKFEI